MTDHLRPLDAEDQHDVDEVLRGGPMPFGMSMEARREAVRRFDRMRESFSAEVMAEKLEVSVEQIQRWREGFEAQTSVRASSSNPRRWMGEMWDHGRRIIWDTGDITFSYDASSLLENRGRCDSSSPTTHELAEWLRARALDPDTYRFTSTVDVDDDLFG